MLLDPIKDKDKIITVIEMFYPNAKIYLFGSYARGDIRSSSDVDVAIDNGAPLDLINPQRIREILSILPFPQNFDIVDFHRIPAPLKENIIKDRIIWKN
jgi:predicted nucleotidyltransferase